MLANKSRPRTNHAKPWVEILEDRCLLSTTIAEFPLSAGSSPFGIATGADGNIWFTESQTNRIGVINPTTHAISEFAITTPNSVPLGITAGADGNIWFTESAANQIGMINPTTHVITEFAIPTAGSQPYAITAGPDGNLWFTEKTSNRIGVINPTTHAVTEYLITTANSSPSGIVAGPDGNLWFTETGASKIATIHPISHVVTEYTTPSANSQPFGITTSPDGFVWFTETNTNRVVKVNPTTHGILEFPIPTAKSGPAGITAGADGNLWFVENLTNKVGSINWTTNVVSEIAIPTATSSAANITTGPGGVLWFTETAGNKIGQVFAPPLVTATPINATVVEGQTATFLAAAAVGLPIPSVAWQVSTNGGASFTLLTNGGVYSGATTGTLTVTGATTAMTGYQYQAVFSNGVGLSAATAPATLTVTSVLTLTPELPQGLPGVIYNQTLSVVGSLTPFTLFSLNNFNGGGTGLVFSNITTNPVNGTITINGTPTAPGTATFTVAIANSAGNTLTKNLTITISPPLSIVTASLPQATAGLPYNQSIIVFGGAQPYTTFSVTNFNVGTTGLIPAAITTLPPAGAFLISATPVAAGTVTFTINVSDSAGTVVTKDYTITVNPALAITPSLPQGTAGTNYQQIITATGGGVPYATFTVTNFNAGATGLTIGNLAINATAGTIAINGTPTAAGTFTFTVNIVDLLGASLTKIYNVAVNPALAITPSLPQGTAGTNYLQTIKVTGGSTPYTTVTVSGFSAGTTGLSVGMITINAGTITMNGTPTAAGTAAFTVNVVDAAGSSLTKAFTITINPPLTIGGLTVNQWTVGKAGFTGVMTVAGGTPPHTITGYSGLPTGLTPGLIGNTISFVGTPTIVATFGFGSVTVRDSAGASFLKTFSITIFAAPTISTLNVTQWTVGKSGFAGVMNASGGTGGLTLVSSSGVPTGLSIALSNNTIRFTGTPTATAAFTGSVTLRDAIGTTVTRTFVITINAPPTLGNLTTTQWTARYAGFTGVIPIAAGTGPFTITSATGLPTGLTAVVSGNTIRFTGTPTVAQTFAAGNITIRDAAGAIVTKTFGITINPPLVIATTTLPTTKMAVLYTTSVRATGGTGAITYTLTAGSMPPGIKLSSNGVISGLSRGFGSFTFTITARDALGATFSQKYTLVLAFR